MTKVKVQTVQFVGMDVVRVYAEEKGLLAKKHLAAQVKEFFREERRPRRLSNGRHHRRDWRTDIRAYL